MYGFWPEAGSDDSRFPKSLKELALETENTASLTGTAPAPAAVHASRQGHRSRHGLTWGELFPFIRLIDHSGAEEGLELQPLGDGEHRTEVLRQFALAVSDTSGMSSTDPEGTPLCDISFADLFPRWDTDLSIDELPLEEHVMHGLREHEYKRIGDFAQIGARHLQTWHRLSREDTATILFFVADSCMPGGIPRFTNASLKGLVPVENNGPGTEGENTLGDESEADGREEAGTSDVVDTAGIADGHGEVDFDDDDEIRDATNTADVSDPKETEGPVLGDATDREDPTAGSPVPALAEASDSKIEALTKAAMRDLYELSEWYALIGKPQAAVLEKHGYATDPEWVRIMRKRALRLRASDILDAHDPAMDLADIIDLKFTGFRDHRFSRILGARTFALKGKTLDDLGREVGVTRERVRQLEKMALDQAMAALQADRAVSVVNEALWAANWTACRLSELVNAFPALGSTVMSVDQPVWQILLAMQDEAEYEDGWILRPSRAGAKARTRDLLAEVANGHGVAAVSDIKLIVGLSAESTSCGNALPDDAADHSIEMSELAQWLRSCGYVIDGPNVYTQTSSVGDYAAAVLSAGGVPLSSDEIVGRFEYTRSPNSLRNHLATDERFDRVDKDRWALREWGHEVYSGIRVEIGERIDRHGGSISLAELIEDLTGTFDISKNSVTIYANNPPFTCINGVVRRNDTSVEMEASPEDEARFYRVPEGWAYRVTLNSDHMRGSGTAAPDALATVLKLKFDESRELTTSLGPQRVSWKGTRPDFGTVRRLIEAQGLSEGTEVFFVIGDYGSFAIVPVRPATGKPLADAVSLINQPPAFIPMDAVHALARGLGKSSLTPFHEVQNAYRRRGDADIADLMDQWSQQK